MRARRASPQGRRQAAAARGGARPGPALVAHIDGGARGNPGPAGYGVHVEAGGAGDAGAAAGGSGGDAGPGGGTGSGRPVAEIYGYLGIATNNTAEYAALLALLEYAQSVGASSLTILSDSELLVRQMRGEYRVKDPKMRVLHAAAQRLVASLPRVVLQHVPRAQNREADALANRAMDLEESSGQLPAALRNLPRPPIDTI